MKRDNSYQKSLECVDKEVSVICGYEIDGQNRI